MSWRVIYVDGKGERDPDPLEWGLTEEQARRIATARSERAKFGSYVAEQELPPARVRTRP